jgi:hypothetical protein
MDVLVADFNADGIGDVYVSNQGPSGTPAPDQLFMSTGSLAWVDASVLLPALPPFASVDAEASDILEDGTATIEILVSAGGRCVFNADGGVQLMFATPDPMVPFGLHPFADLTIFLPPGIQAGPAFTVPFVNDMELGDWSGVTHVRDVGMATNSPLGGHMFMTR